MTAMNSWWLLIVGIVLIVFGLRYKAVRDKQGNEWGVGMVAIGLGVAFIAYIFVRAIVEALFSMAADNGNDWATWSWPSTLLALAISALIGGFVWYRDRRRYI